MSEPKPSGVSFKDIAPPLKKVIVDVVEDQVMKKATEGLTFLAWPVISPVTRFILNKLLWFLIDETAIGLTTLWVVLDLSYEVSSVEKATKRLKEIIDNPGKYTGEQMKEIEENFDEKAVNLIHLALLQL